MTFNHGYIEKLRRDNERYRKALLEIADPDEFRRTYPGQPRVLMLLESVALNALEGK